MKGSLHYTLERHIFHLLFQEDSVDVPGFGRLEAQRFGAEIQLQSGLFLPPRVDSALALWQEKVNFYSTICPVMKD